MCIVKYEHLQGQGLKLSCYLHSKAHIVGSCISSPPKIDFESHGEEHEVFFLLEEEQKNVGVGLCIS